MDLKAFIAKQVSPGEPLTAQAWNDIVDAIDGAYKFLQASMHTVHVQVTGAGLDPDSVRVTAVRAGSPPIDAVRPVSPDTQHVLSGLEPGSYTIRAEAPAFAVGTATVDVGASADTKVQIALNADGSIMPDLFGLTLAAARAALGALSIPITRLLDFEGNEMAPVSTSGEFDGVPVLVQSPLPGVPVPQGGTARLVVAVKPAIDAAIEVPSLAGFTQVEAQKALEALGLVLGKVRIVSQ